MKTRSFLLSFRLVRNLLFFSFFSQMALQASPLPPVKLPRMTKVTVAETTAKLQSDMNRAWWHLFYLISVTGVTVVASIRGGVHKLISRNADRPYTKERRDKAETDLNEYLMSYSSLAARAVLVTLWASGASLIWASWQDAAENASSSLKRWLVGLTRGYKGWLLHETAVLEKNARVLYHSLTYASNSNVPAAQLVNYQPIMKDDDELAHLGYRGDSARRFEHMYNHVARILSLMFLVTPKAKHEEVQKDVTIITQHLNSLASLVERDINSATSRFIVEYQKKTQLAFVGLFEELHARLAPYDIAARA